MQIWNYLDIQFRLSETKLTDKILFGGVGSWCAGAWLNLLWQSKEKKCSINQLKKINFSTLQYSSVNSSWWKETGIMMKRNKQAVQLTAKTSLFITLARNHNYNAKALFVCFLLVIVILHKLLQLLNIPDWVEILLYMRQHWYIWEREDPGRHEIKNTCVHVSLCNTSCQHTLRWLE